MTERVNPDWTRELVTIDEACARVGVSRRTVYNWLDSGKVEYIRTAGGNARIYADTLFKPGLSKPGKKENS